MGGSFFCSKKFSIFRTKKMEMNKLEKKHIKKYSQICKTQKS